MLERPKHEKLPRSRFRDMVRIIIFEIFLQNRKPTAQKIKDDLRSMDISLASGGPSDIREILEKERCERLRRRLEAIAAEERSKREAIVADLRDRQKKFRPEDSLVGSPMANLGFGGNGTRHIRPSPNSDREYPND